MPADIIKNSTSISTLIRITDFEGMPATTIAFDTVGLDVWCRRDGGLKTSIPLSALAAANSAYVDGGFIHVGDGYYRVDAPNAAFATGSGGVLVAGTLTGFRIDGSYHALIDPAGGSGPHIVTVTVTNQVSVPLQNASVRLSQGTENHILTTNASGVATFSVGTATWDVSITKADHTFTPTTLAVAADTPVTYAMTQTTTPADPAAPLLSTGRLIVHDVTGLPAAGIEMAFRQDTGSGAAGEAWSNEEFKKTSIAGGVIEHTGFLRGAQYTMRLGKARVQFTVPNASSFDLPAIVGPEKI